MELKVSYKKPAVIQALRYHFISKPEIKTMVVLVNVFALLTVGLYAFKMITPLPFLMSSVLWLAMMLAFWVWLPALIYRRSKTFKDSFTVTIEENHMFIDTDRGRKTFAWREFSNFFETPGFFHLYFDPRSFFLLPKDAFADSDQVHRARQIMKAGIKRKT
ncbi:YcxB family protein [Pollutibacter soli]|uniref:YcxB family protein n=1 Tax=Pollutibacter soli TaxID=3034157 RepID=UPI003013DE88